MTLLLPEIAHADESIIKSPGDHPSYIFEAEPHGLVGWYHVDKFSPGVGFRGTFKIIDNGFIASINNSIGIGAGIDWTQDRIWVPIVMQWNFWISENWSVFGEPGVAITVGGTGNKKGKNDAVDLLAIWGGARYHFTDRITLTMRVGKPTLSIGVSFLL
jgi:hypothetical protein